MFDADLAIISLMPIRKRPPVSVDARAESSGLVSRWRGG